MHGRSTKQRRAAARRRRTEASIAGRQFVEAVKAKLDAAEQRFVDAVERHLWTLTARDIGRAIDSLFTSRLVSLPEDFGPKPGDPGKAIAIVYPCRCVPGQLGPCSNPASHPRLSNERGAPTVNEAFYVRPCGC